jgi:hypothetical protein
MGERETPVRRRMSSYFDSSPITRRLPLVSTNGIYKYKFPRSSARLDADDQLWCTPHMRCARKRSEEKVSCVLFSSLHCTSIAHNHRRGERSGVNTPSCDPATAAWFSAALAMPCGVRPTRGGVEPKSGERRLSDANVFEHELWVTASWQCIYIIIDGTPTQQGLYIMEVEVDELNINNVNIHMSRWIHYMHCSTHVSSRRGYVDFVDDTVHLARSAKHAQAICCGRRVRRVFGSYLDGLPP